MQAAGQWILILAFVFSLAGAIPPGPVQAAEASAGVEPLLQSSTLQMVSPSNCPPGGCAAGQRLSMRFDFDPNGFSADQSPNVKVCIFVPNSWGVEPASVTVAGNGEVTNEPYTNDVANSCTQTVDGYTLIVDRAAALKPGAFADALNFSFRLGPAAKGNGRVLAQLFVNINGTWDMIPRATSPTLSITDAATPAYVANDVAACGSNSPCYVNSADDLDGGIGTGLKDAVDATPEQGNVIILGTYTIKSTTVDINRLVALTGSGNASITFTGPGVCNKGGMLALNRGINVTRLNITDGICSSPDRNLIEVNSEEPVAIESNDLFGGDNAILIKDNKGTVTIRYNDIRGNKGFAVFSEGSSNNSVLDVTANNVVDNTSSIQCAADINNNNPLPNRRANHNYWSGGAPTASESHCTLVDGKRLGMPIAVKENAPGVDAQAVPVTDKKTYAFNNQIAFSRTGGSDFDLYIINHGYATAGGPPFTYALGGESPSPCSNYWDIYLPPGSPAPSGTLELFFKYDKTSGCLAAINSSMYCDQNSDAGKYPLFWYDPVNNATKWWDKTSLRPENLSSGNGQTTKCNVDQNEIQVSIDGTGRPDLQTDLGYTPFMVGVPVIRSFQPLAVNQAVNVTWITNNEPDIEGFYVLRSNDGINFTPISDLIAHTGTALVGKSYTHSDTGRSNGVTYYYRLQVLRTDGASIYSAIVPIKPNIPTITPTATRFLTLTRTPVLITPTRTFTRVSFLQPTRNLTPSPTLRGRTPSPTFLVLSTLTSAPDTSTPDPFADTPIPGGYTAPGEGETEAPFITPGSGTPVAAVISGTPAPTSSPELPGTLAGESTAAANPWLSLFLGILTGLAATAGLGGWWYYYHVRR